MRFDTLDQVVRDICEIGGGDMQHKNYGTVLKICVRTLQDLNLFTQIPNYKTVELEVMPNLTARMPDDVLRPLKIGKCENGRLVELRYSQDMCMPVKRVPCCECENEVKVYETIEKGSEGGGTGLCDYRIEFEDEECTYSVEGIELEPFACVTFDEGVTDNAVFSIAFIYEFGGAIAISTSQGSTLSDFLQDIESNISVTPSPNITFSYEMLDNGVCFKATGEINGAVDLNVSDMGLEGDLRQLGDLWNVDSNLQLVDDTPTGNAVFQGVFPRIFQVNINGSWVDQTSEVSNGSWSLTTDDTVTEWRIIDANENVVQSGEVTVECTGIDFDGKTLEVLINNQWVDVTSEINDGVWERLQSEDKISSWRLIETEPSCTYSKEGIGLASGQRFRVVINGSFQDVTEEIDGNNWVRANTDDEITNWQIVTPRDCYSVSDVQPNTFSTGGASLFASTDLSERPSIDTNGGADIVVKLYGQYIDSNGDLQTFDLIDTTIASGVQWSDINALILGADTSGVPFTIFPSSPFEGAFFQINEGKDVRIFLEIYPDNGDSFDFSFRLNDNASSTFVDTMIFNNGRQFEIVFIQSQSFQIEVDGVWEHRELVNGAWSDNSDNGIVTAARLVHVFDGDVYIRGIYENTPVNLSVADCPIVESEGVVDKDCTPNIITGEVESECDDPPIPAYSYQQIKSIEKVKPDCNGKGVCKQCGKPQNNQQAQLPDTRFIPDVIRVSNSVAQIDAFFNYNNIRNTQFFIERFGQRPHPARYGWFNYDLVSGLIKLDGNWSEGDKLLFMYRTEMQEQDGTKVVPVECFNMLLYRCKEMLWNRNRPDMMNQRELYETEYKRIKRLYNKMTLQEWEDAISGYRYSSVKR